MAVGTSNVGRPYRIANLPAANTERLEFLSTFWNATSSLQYRDIIPLSRALGVQPSTVENWKYKITVPRYDIVFDVLEWIRQGKPTRVIKQSEGPPARVM